MARIFTYDQDADLNLNDKVIGSNSGDNVTKNFSIESLLELANAENFIKQFDGIVFKAQDHNIDSDQFGIITTGTGAYTSTDFSVIQTLYLSTKNLQNKSVAEYIDVLAGYDVRITQKGDTNNFGIYRVDSITDSTDGTYKILSVSVQDASGLLTKDAEYYVSTLGNNLKNLNSFSVTELNDVTSAGSGAIITDGERQILSTVNDKINITDIANNVTTNDSSKVLAASQGVVLKQYIDDINTLLTSDNIDLDSLQEVVDYIEANKATLDSLSISNIAGLQTALDGKVDKVTGKELSANDFTDALLNKLNNIEANAEVNVQSDWNQSTTTADNFIQNKPTDLTVLSNHSVTGLNDVTSAGSGIIITTSERSKLSGISANAEQNVQSNWTETDTNSDSFIQNKPVILDQNTTITIAGTANEIAVTPNTAQDLSQNRTFTISLPDDVTIGDDLTVTDDLIVQGDTTTDNITVDDVLAFTTAQSNAPNTNNAVYVKSVDGAGVLHFRYNNKDVAIDDITENMPTGITSGGNLSVANTTQFTIAAGTGIINDLNKESSATVPHPEIKHISWAQQTITVQYASSTSSQSNTWIYVDENGTVQQQATTFTDAQQSNKIIIGSVITSNSTIDFVRTFPVTAYSAVKQIQEFTRIFGALKKSGYKLTANGANLKLDRASGVSWAQGRNYGTDPNNPSVVSDAAKTESLIHRYYSDGSTGHTKDSNAGAGYATIDPTKYDDGSGTLANVSSGHFTVQRLYYFPGFTNVIVAYYGKDHYSSMEVAEKEYLLEEFIEADNTAEQAIYLGALVVRGNATTLNNSDQAKILTAGVFRSLAAVSIGGSSVASNLSDLTDVHVASPSNNQILQYDAADGRFENITLTTDNITEGSTNLFDQTVAFTNGDNISVTGTYPNFTIASSHPNISGATSADNSGLTYVQDLTLDSNGHVTGITSTTINTGAISNGSSALATGDQIYDFVTGQNYLSANQTITLTGDITGSGTTSIATTIASTAIEGSMLNNNVISGQTALTSGLASTDELLVSDDGTIKRMDIDVLKTYMQSNLTFTTNTDTNDDVSVANLTARLPQITESFTIGDATDVTVTTAGSLTVTGDLTVNGTTTSVNTETVTINDNIILLNKNATTGTNGGIHVERGSTGTDASLIWNEAQDKWYAGLAGAEVQILTTADEGTGNGLDADTLDGYQGTYYLNYSNLTNTPTIPSAANDATITLTAGTGLSGGGDFTTDQNANEEITFALDFNELTDMTADISGTTEFVLQNNNVESRKSANEIKLSAFNNDSGFTTNTGTVTSVGTQTGLTGTITSTGNIGLDINALNAETSLGDGDVLLFYDSSASLHKKITKANLIAATQTYTDGNGLTLTGTQFDVDSDQRGVINKIGQDTNGYYEITSSDVHNWYSESSSAAQLNMRLQANGELLTRGDVVAFSTTVTSDESLKDNISTIPNALETVNKLRGVEFDWNAGPRKGKHDIGVVAQEVEKVIPDIVHEKEMLDGKSIKTVDYEKITGVLIEAVKDLTNKVNNLEKQLKDANS